jgi:hypothetical protein
VFGDFTLSTGNPAAAMLAPGSVVVSEYMNNPAAVFDSAGEWIELFNTAGDALDLAGFTIRDQGIDAFVLPSLTIPSRGYVVLARNGSPALNGGVVPDFTWPGGSFILSNGSDEIEVVDTTGAVLDSVVYDDGATFPDPDGKSVERKDTTALPWASNFGEATTPFGVGDLGTPGAANSLSVGPVFTNLSISGPLTAGTTAFVTVFGGTTVAGKPYILAASECMSPGLVLPFSGRELHLCTSMLFDLSLTPGNPFFLGFSGTFNPVGLATPSVAIPAVPGLTGLTIFISGVVIDPIAIEGVLSIVDVTPLTIN